MIPEPPFTEAHEAFRLQAREFVLGELRPQGDEWEEAGWFPNAVLAEELAVRAEKANCRAGPRQRCG